MGEAMGRRIRWGDYSIDEANATLPLVRAIATDVIQVASEVELHRSRLEGRVFGEGNSTSFHEQEVAAERAELHDREQRLQEHLGEFAELGAGASDGRFGPAGRGQLPGHIRRGARALLLARWLGRRSASARLHVALFVVHSS